MSQGNSWRKGSYTLAENPSIHKTNLHVVLAILIHFHRNIALLLCRLDACIALSNRHKAILLELRNAQIYRK